MDEMKPKQPWTPGEWRSDYAKLVAEYEEDAKYDIDGVLRCDWKTRKVVDSPEIAAARAALDLCGWKWGGR